MLLNFISEVLCPNFGRNTDYPACGVLWFYLECLDSNLRQATSASFCIIFKFITQSSYCSDLNTDRAVKSNENTQTFRRFSRFLNLIGTYFLLL
jgi:hypothetical protein